MAKKGKFRTADLKGKAAGLYATLRPVADKANAHWAAADKADGKAEEHRLAAALTLADAKIKCDKAKVNFKRWCADNISFGYENARKLAAVGSAEEPKLALADYRARAATAMRRSRTKARVAKAVAQLSRGSQGRVTRGRKPERSPSFDALAVLVSPDMTADNMRHSAAEKLATVIGKSLVSKADGAVINKARGDVAEVVREFFGRLSYGEKRLLVAELAGACDGVVKFIKPLNAGEGKDATADDLLDIPDYLKRETAAPKTTRKRAKVGARPGK